jgi:sulfur transfer complex TusBCD TusB component (DsrH family)
MIIQLLSNTPFSVFSYCDLAVPIIMLQNGVYSASLLSNKYPSNTFYALENDWLASGLIAPVNVTLISASKWVDLCAQQHPVITIQQ